MPTQTLPRVLVVVPSAFCFGLQHAELALFSALRGRVQCHFLTTRWSDGEFARRLDELELPHSATWLGMFSRRLDWRNLKMTAHCLLKLPLAWLDFARLCRSFRPDIVYVANHHEVLLLLPLLAARRGKVVCHMHDPPPPIPFQKWSAALWRRSVGRFLFVSENVRARIAALTPLAPHDAVIHNGVAVTPEEPAARTARFTSQFGWPADAVVFGVTGQIAAHKGHGDFIAAAALARTACTQARFVIGGRGPQKEVARLESLIAAHGLGDVVCFGGWLPDARAFYEAIDVLVLPSRHDEGFGLVVTEAGERGVPAIATRSGGVVEIVEDGETGLLVAKAAPQELAAAIQRLAGDADLRRAMGDRARARIKARFDLQTQARRVADWMLNADADRAA